MRKTFHYDPVTREMVEGPAPRKGESGDSWKFSDRLYSDAPFTAHDGTIIDSRRKHREYMKRNNLTTHDDFKGEFERRAGERADVFTGKHDREGRARDIARALEKHRG